MRALSTEHTPTGLQSRGELERRRWFVAFAFCALYATQLAWLYAILDTHSATDIAILVAFAVAAPWSALGVCNALIGFWLLHFRPAGLEEVAPFASAGSRCASPHARSALLLTIRNEDAGRAFSHLRAMVESLEATGEGAAFDWFVLSDTTDPVIAAAEERQFGELRGEARIRYRRRTDNIGFKAGNIHDFCARWGADYEFMIPLDADSLMDGETILALVRIGEAHPRIGILQSLVVGAPSQSAFARIFQFGMRAGMRTYTMGATWWAGDCGPFWGHNALVRIAPFMRHCMMPKLDGDRRILSHDQIEAVLMRRAGYEVRALPVECGSYEENPPTLLDFVARDLRWCQGNMQYIELLGLPGLLAMSRFQLIWAISMFIGAPASTAIVALAALKAAQGGISTSCADSALAFYGFFLLSHLAPKLAGYADVAITPGALARYGGALRFCLGAFVEIFCSFVIGAVTTFNETMFLCALPFGRTIGWGAQARDAHGLSLRIAVRALWPHLLFGAAVMTTAGVCAPRLLAWSLPLTIGYIVAVPFARITATPRTGAWFARSRICATPEEFAPPEILRALSRGRPGEKSTT
jgi:membrane glycosyltransferase